MPASSSPSRWKRLLYSILSVFLVALVASFAASVIQLWSLPHFNLRLVLLQTSITGLFALIACIPGWLIALGFVLSVTNFSGWRFLAIWALGTAIGPLVILGVSLFFFMSSLHAGAFFYPVGMAWFSVAIACPATLLYLLLVRSSQRRARLRAAAGTPQPGATTPTS